MGSGVCLSRSNKSPYAMQIAFRLSSMSRPKRTNDCLIAENTSSRIRMIGKAIMAPRLTTAQLVACGTGKPVIGHCTATDMRAFSSSRCCSIRFFQSLSDDSWLAGDANNVRQANTSLSICGAVSGNPSLSAWVPACVACSLAVVL